MVRLSRSVSRNSFSANLDQRKGCEPDRFRTGGGFTLASIDVANFSLAEFSASANSGWFNSGCFESGEILESLGGFSAVITWATPSPLWVHYSEDRRRFLPDRFAPYSIATLATYHRGLFFLRAANQNACKPSGPAPNDECKE